MKKVYISPLAEIDEVDYCEMIASSDRNVESEVPGGPTWGGGGGPAGPPEAKTNNHFFQEDEENENEW